MEGRADGSRWPIVAAKSSRTSCAPHECTLVASDNEATRRDDTTWPWPSSSPGLRRCGARCVRFNGRGQVCINQTNYHYRYRPAGCKHVSTATEHDNIQTHRVLIFAVQDLLSCRCEVLQCQLNVLLLPDDSQPSSRACGVRAEPTIPPQLFRQHTLDKTYARNSLHTALMSAPDRSSFAITSSSRSTSSESDIREVCSLKMCRFVFVSGRGNSGSVSAPPLLFAAQPTNLPVDSSRSDQCWVEGLYLRRISLNQCP